MSEAVEGGMTSEEILAFAKTEGRGIAPAERIRIVEACQTMAYDDLARLYGGLCALREGYNRTNSDLRAMRDSIKLGPILSEIAGADCDLLLIEAARRLQVALCEQNRLDNAMRDNPRSKLVVSLVETIVKGHAADLEGRIALNKSAAKHAKLKAAQQSRRSQEARAAQAEEDRKAAEYAALLAEGRKSRTLQQAYANGDFIPLDDDDTPSIKSSTGHRLGARG